MTVARRTIKKIDTAQGSCILELEQLPAAPADTAALCARIHALFAEQHAAACRRGAVYRPCSRRTV